MSRGFKLMMWMVACVVGFGGALASTALAGEVLPEAERAPPTSAMLTKSGLAYQTLQKGKAKHRMKPSTRVTVHYTGWLAETGEMFDSSVERDEPLTVALNEVVKGWSEGVALMRVGEKTRFWIPPELAYGNDPNSGRPYGTLVFDVELLEIAPEIKLKTPKFGRVPGGAKTTSSGLAYKVLQKGTGTVQPSRRDSVLVHYTGWQDNNGRLFDSSVLRNERIVFPLNGIIRGLAEGISLMVVGEKRRFWIPGKLAYGEDKEGMRPYGRLIFDVELFEIIPGEPAPSAVP